MEEMVMVLEELAGELMGLELQLRHQIVPSRAGGLPGPPVRQPTHAAEMQTQMTNNAMIVPCNGGHMAPHSTRRREDA
jgi:hypothetical protein